MKDLSLVIIGKNAASSIARLLDSLIACVPSHLSTELFYVDSASTDRTVEIVGQYPVTILLLSPDQPLCASAGRHMGSRYATGKYLFFLDSDMELLDGWLERALRELDAHPDIAVITGIVIETDPVLKTHEIPAVDYGAYNAESSDIHFAGGAAVFRHSVLREVGSWNPYLISEEEPELCLRIRKAGYRVVHIDYPLVRHHSTSSFTIRTVLARRKRRLYLGSGQVIRYYASSTLLIRYLRERGHGVKVAALAFLGIVSIALSRGLMNSGSVAMILGSLAIVIVADSIRTRSFYLPFFHLFHRAVILEGTIRGFCVYPYSSADYPGKITVMSGNAMSSAQGPKYICLPD